MATFKGVQNNLFSISENISNSSSPLTAYKYSYTGRLNTGGILRTCTQDTPQW